MSAHDTSWPPSIACRVPRHPRQIPRPRGVITRSPDTTTQCGCHTGKSSKGLGIRSCLDHHGGDLMVILESKIEKRAAAAKRCPAFTSINIEHVRQSLAEALLQIGKLEIFEEYTKHDITHIDGMFDILDFVITDKAVDAMTDADWLMLCLSVYLHDFGLVVTRTEFDKRAETDFPKFKYEVLHSTEDDYTDYRAALSGLSAESSEKFLYQEFVRQHHAARIRSWLSAKPDARIGNDPAVTLILQTLLTGIDPVFIEDLGIVCESHHADDLQDREKYPRDRPYGQRPGETCNLQFVAILLRTADLLHITRDRVPSIASMIIDPRNAKSQREWAKQRSVRSVRPAIATDADGIKRPELPSDTLEVHGRLEDADGYFGLNAYLRYAGEQLLQSANWVRESAAKDGSSYEFPWRHINTDHVEARGFVPKPFEFDLDHKKILELLTGHTLYNDTAVVVRELVQNSLDAVRLEVSREDTISPEVRIIWNEGARTLQVIDNGTGMTQADVEQHFLKVGSSKYETAAFKKANASFAAISRFGIGVLTAFMVADHVTVITSHNDESAARRITLRSVHGNYLVELLDKSDEADVPRFIAEHGTSIMLQFRASARTSFIEDALREWIVLPGCPVTLTLAPEGSPKEIGFSGVEDALSAQLLKSDMIRKDPDSGFKSRYGQPVEIRTASQDGVTVAYAVAWNRWLETWQFLSWTSERMRRTKLASLGICIQGIRVTTGSPGFRAGGIAAIASVTGIDAPRTNVARSDLERSGDLERTLEVIYRQMLRHVTGEINALVESRGYSSTRAGREAGYLVEPLVSGAVAASDEALSRAIDDVKAFVLEEGGVRRRVALAELASVDILATVDSTVITRLEEVMSSSIGGGNASLLALTRTLGIPDYLPESEVPLLCDIGGRSYYAKRYRAQWQPVRLQSKHDGRILVTQWSRRQLTQPVWVSGEELDEVSSEFVNQLYRYSEAELPDIDTSDVHICRRPDLVAFEPSEEILRLRGAIYLSPRSPLMQLIDDCTSSAARATVMYAICWMISNILRRSRSGIYQRATLAGQTEAEARDQYFEILSHAGLGEVVNLEAIRKAIKESAFDVADVERWGRRNLLGADFD